MTFPDTPSVMWAAFWIYVGIALSILAADLIDELRRDQ